MTDEEKSDEIKEKMNELMNRISLALKDATLAQGFEIICKRISELEKENNSIKQILINLVTAFNNYECAGSVQEQENTWETLRDLMHEELLKIEKGNK